MPSPIPSFACIIPSGICSTPSSIPLLGPSGHWTSELSLPSIPIVQSTWEEVETKPWLGSPSTAEESNHRRLWPRASIAWNRALTMPAYVRWVWYRWIKGNLSVIIYTYQPPTSPRGGESLPFINSLAFWEGSLPQALYLQAQRWSLV